MMTVKELKKLLDEIHDDDIVFIAPYDLDGVYTVEDHDLSRGCIYEKEWLTGHITLFPRKL